MKKGAIFTEEHKLNLRLSHLGKTPWNKGKLIKPKSARHCEKCAVAFFGRSGRRFCSVSCSRKGNTYGSANLGQKRGQIKTHSNHPSGKQHYKWIADRSSLKTSRKQAYDVRYREWMRSVKNRDGWKCRIANKDCLGNVEAHHILRWSDYPELRYEVGNGISLCNHHHPRRKEDELKLSPLFQSLVFNSHHYVQ